MRPLAEPACAVRRRVVVVDDEQDIRDLMLMWLQDDPRCLSVAEAADLGSAVELIARQRPDVVLLDFYLGHRVCAEALPDMRASAPDTTIVVYTASRRAAEAAGVLALGADFVVEKGSVSVDDVVEMLLDERVSRPVR
ncbi:MAG TPA: response regulator [Mycobacteriales bacterium]|nr:response regulator [Mycobacteriales bacterium]